MLNRQTLLAVLALTLCLTGTYASADAKNIQRIEQLANNAERSEENRARNRHRHPAQTLDFFGIQPNMSVIELWPVKGWYTEILGPYLKDEGQLTIANFKTVTADDDRKANFYARLGRELSTRINNDSDYFGTVMEVPFDPKDDKSLGMPGTQDMVLTFRNIHNWDSNGVFKDVLTAAFEALKPGGVLGVVEHKADQLSNIAASAVEGYTDESYVIRVAESVGFVLEARSGINANPMDSKDHPRGVYALPPTLAMGKVDRAKYLAIGESDRMTLKFVKPLK